MRKRETEIQQKENKMGTMPVGKLIATMSWPAVLSMMIQALYNVVDSIFVAHLSEKALTAVTLVYPAQIIIIAVGVGTGIGINSLIARRLGEKRFEEASAAAGNGFRLAIYSWLVFLLFGIFFSKMFISAFSSDGYILQNGTYYLRIVMIFSVFGLMQMVTEKILQSTGNMIMPMISSLTGAVINIILDPILIFGLLGAPKLGVAGAAIATVTGQMVASFAVMMILFRGNHPVKVRIKGFRHDRQILREIYAVGLPAILMQSIMSLMLFGVNMILAGFSSAAVAVNGAYGRLQSFIFMPVIGINQGTTPIIGYNYGARNRIRLMKTYRLALLTALCIMAAGFFVFQMFPDMLLRMFDAKGAMYEIGIPALRIVSICFLPAAFGIITSGFFQATGHGFTSLVASLIRQLIGVLPLAFILARSGGVMAVWWAFPLAEIMGVAYLGSMLRHTYKREIMSFSD